MLKDSSGAGRSENASQRPGLFAENDRAHRIYRRVGEAARLPEFPIAAGDQVRFRAIGREEYERLKGERL